MRVNDYILLSENVTVIRNLKLAQLCRKLVQTVNYSIEVIIIQNYFNLMYSRVTYCSLFFANKTYLTCLLTHLI